MTTENQAPDPGPDTLRKIVAITSRSPGMTERELGLSMGRIQEICEAAIPKVACVDPMCACRGGPCAECPEGEREKELADLKSSLDFYKRRCDALQACQSTMRDPERTMVCDILANGSLLINGKGKLAAERYAIPAPEGALRAALERIAAIENKLVGPDWEEIDEAREIARAALAAPAPKIHPDGAVNPTPQTPVECSVCGGIVIGVAAPAPQAPGMALVPVETLAAWKSMVNSLAVQSLRSERTTTGVILKSLIQDEIDAATQTQEPTNDR